MEKYNKIILNKVRVKYLGHGVMIWTSGCFSEEGYHFD